MAYIKLKNGKGTGISKEQGLDIWAILQGEKEPSPEQEKFVNQIDTLSLSFNSAPDSYIQEHLAQFVAWCKREWSVDYSGNPTRPQNKEQWDIAKKWNFQP